MAKKSRSEKSERQKKLEEREKKLHKRTGTREKEKKVKKQVEKQKQKKAKGEEGKTEITIEFESHYPQMVGKKKEMEEADIIIPEQTSKTIEKLKEAETEEELKKVAKEETKFLEYSEKKFKVYKEMQEEGKEIKGKMGRTNYILPQSPEEKAKSNEEREKERLKKLKKIIRENPGKKIYIEAGANHTPVYHKLKEELGEKENIEIKRKHLVEKDLHEKAGYPEQTKEAYPPRNQLMRHFRFDTETAQRYKKLQEAKEKKKNPEKYFDSKEEYEKAKQAEKKIKNLEKQEEKFQEIEKEKKREKRDLGMSEGEAMYEAYLETLKEMREKKKTEESLWNKLIPWR